MAVVTFFEKPGCSGNARQKQALEAAGHVVVSKDLLRWPWTRSELLSYFDGMPVAHWFNRNSPAVKSGEIVPEEFDEETALALLQRHPLLIRRPLLEVAGVRRAGFDVAVIHAWIGLGPNPPEADMEACQHGQEGHICQGHPDDEPCGHHAGKEHPHA
jgi:nitrogenase-associated protein